MWVANNLIPTHTSPPSFAVWRHTPRLPFSPLTSVSYPTTFPTLPQPFPNTHSTHTPYTQATHTPHARRQLEVLRQQVRLTTSARFQAARKRLERWGPAHDDRSVRSLLRESGRVGVHPMNRNIAAQEAEGGLAAGSEDQVRCMSGRGRDWGRLLFLGQQVWW